MDLSRFKLEREEHFRAACESTACLIRIGDIPREEFEEELRKDFLSWGGDPAQWDDMLSMFRNYCKQPPAKKSQSIPEEPSPAWLEDESKPRIRIIVDRLEKPQWFRFEYQDCIRAARAVITNDPPSWKARNARLRHLTRMKSRRSIKKYFQALPIVIQSHLKLIMKLKGFNEVEAAKWILSVGQDNKQNAKHTALTLRSDFTYIETRLALSFIIAGGRITKYIKKGARTASGKSSKYSEDDTDYASDFIILLRQFRVDCGEAAPDPSKLTAKHISHLLADIREQIFGSGNMSAEDTLPDIHEITADDPEFAHRVKRTFDHIRSHCTKKTPSPPIQQKKRVLVLR